MKFNKGSELDKQIYKEGEPTWGLKKGFLDVEDVQNAIKQIRIELGNMSKEDWENVDEMERIRKIVGNKLFIEISEEELEEGTVLTHKLHKSKERSGEE